MKTQLTTMKRQIMRRVYLAYGKSILLHRAFLQGAALSIGLAVFASQVHVASVIENLLAIQVASVPSFILNAFLRGEVLTILALGAIVMSALSFGWQIRPARWFEGRRQMA